MKIWITKYALSKGIVVEHAEHRGGDLWVFSGGFVDSRLEGRDWHRTEESAMACAEEMRVKKIASLKKNISKLENLTF